MNHRRQWPYELTMWAAGLVCVLFLFLLLIRDNMNLLAAILMVCFLLALSIRDKAAGAISALLYLNLMGDIRRVLDVAFGNPVLDLLLLVAPGFAFMMAVPILLKVRLTDALSKTMLALMLIMAIEIVNPQQGGVIVGLSGAIFYIAPVLWFWVAREYASPQVIKRLLYWGLFPLALAAAFLGFFQTFVGFLPFEQAWIEGAAKTYHALYVGKSVRAFGFSVSGAEYAALLAIGAVGTIAAFFGNRRLWSAAALVLIPALVLSSSRALVLKLIVALAVVWTVRRGNKLKTLALARIAAFAVFGLLGVGLIASRYSPAQPGGANNGSAAQNLLAHQAGGLAHPLDKRYSTAGLHSGMITKGILSGFTDPIGHGLGSTTLAGRKLGDGSTGDSDDAVGSSEMDFSDMFIALGFVGGLVYITVIYLTMRQAFVYLNRVELGVSLPVIGILTLMLTGWLIGGQYSTSSVIFFLIGGLAYDQRRQGAQLGGVLRMSMPERAFSQFEVQQDLTELG